MLVRLLELRVPIEMWFAVGHDHKDKDLDRLSVKEWVVIGDIVDMLGMFRPLTVSLEKAGDAAIVHLLP